MWCSTVAALALVVADSTAKDPATRAVSLPRITQPPVIDGALTDSAWRNAAKLTDFVQYYPDEKKPGRRKSVAYVAYDADNLYVAFVAEESRQNLRATVFPRERGGQADDRVGIYLDVFGDQRRAYYFSVNPHGIQSDGMHSEGHNHPDNSPDYIWYSAGQVTDSGWTVEIRIPFTSIRFPSTEEFSVGLNITRHYGKTSEGDSWAPRVRGNPCDICQQGWLTGIRGVKQKRTVDVRPYMATERADARQYENALVPSGDRTYPVLRPLGFEQGPFSSRAGMDLRFTLTPAFTLNATLNPDFSQVESDELQVTVNQRFALFYRERRPFFVEGGDAFQQLRGQEDQFNGPGTSFYSRAIADPAIGVRLTGKSGPWTTAVLYARDDRPNSFWFQGAEAGGIDTLLTGSADAVVARVKRDVLSNSYVGMISTLRRQGDQQNGVLGFDANLKSGNYTLYVDGGMSAYRGALLTTALDTTGACPAGYIADPSSAENDCTHFLHDGENLSGGYYMARLSRYTSSTYAAARVYGVSRGYRNQLGLLARSATEGYSGYLKFTQYPGGSIFQSISEEVYAAKTYRYRGGGLDYIVQPRLTIGAPRGTYLSIGPNFDQTRIYGTPVNLARMGYFLVTSPLRWLEVFAFGQIGDLEIYDPTAPRAGKGINTFTNLTFKPTARASVKVGATKVNHFEKGTGDEVDDATLFDVRGEYQFTRKLGFRAIVQQSNQRSALITNPFYDDIASSGSGLLMSYEVAPTSFFYLGYNGSWQDFQSPLTDRDRRIQTGGLVFCKLTYLMRM
jgi:hypothetical protein